MRNRYGAGALALSAGLSVYTLSSLPRGGVAGRWATTESRWSLPSPSWPKRFAASARPIKAAPARAIGLTAAQLALTARPEAEPVGPAASVPTHPGSFFQKRPVEPAARAPTPLVRADSTLLILPGQGSDRVLGFGDDGVGSGAPTGALEGFRWQEGPRVRDDATPR